MSRVIKFRAWIDTYYYYFTLSELADKSEPLTFKHKGYDISLDQYPIEQFTGLLDKNGREIYEGDVVRINYPAGYSLIEVKFGIYDNNAEWSEDRNYGNGFYGHERKYFTKYGHDPTEDYINHFHPEAYPLAGYPLEIIGNIHETVSKLSAKPQNDGKIDNE